MRKFELAVKKLLNQIEREARCYRAWSGTHWYFDEVVWKKADPIMYRHWKRVSDLLYKKDDGHDK